MTRLSEDSLIKTSLGSKEFFKNGAWNQLQVGSINHNPLTHSPESHQHTFLNNGLVTYYPNYLSVDVANELFELLRHREGEKTW